MASSFDTAGLIAWIGATGSLLAAIVAIWAVLRNSKIALETTNTSSKMSLAVMQATFLNDFRREFDRISPVRLVASQHALKRWQNNGLTEISCGNVPPEIWQLMDFFDRLAMYLKRGYIDYKMSFISFMYWMLPYCKCYERDVENMRGQIPLAMWHEIPRQLELLKEISIGLDVTRENLAQSQSWDRIKTFLEIESAECKSESPAIG